MKDWNFIERLNQYIDGELPPSEVPQLEAELQADPRKMATYRQYLRMNRGGQELCRAVAAEALAPKFRLDQNVIWVPKTVTARRRAFPAWGWQAMLGGATAAAALTVYLFPWSTQSTGPVVARSTPAPEPALPNALSVSEGSLNPFRSVSQRLRRETPRMDNWSRMVAIEVPSEIPQMPANLPTPPSMHPSLRVQESILPAAGMPAYHGGSRGTFSGSFAAPSFASYEFQR